MPSPTLTLADLAGRDVCSVEECAAILGISRGSAYAACRRGELAALRVGSRFIIPTRSLARLLGVEPDCGDDPESAPPRLVILDGPPQPKTAP
jgi:excisionase family DNA binding protein